MTESAAPQTSRSPHASDVLRRERVRARLKALGGYAAYAGLALALWAASHGSATLGLSPAAAQAAVLVLFTIGAWAFGLFPEPVTTLSFFLLAVLLHVAKPEIIFAGFHSAAWWLVFGGAVTGLAVRTTGLGTRLAATIFALKRPTYPRYVASVMIASVGLAFVMPSTTGRILLLIPIVLALADRIGLTEGRRGRTGLVMTVAAGSYMPPTTILPANIPNSVLMGAADSFYGVKLHYAPYLLLHFPVLGALKAAILVWVVCRLFPDDGPLAPPGATTSPPLTTDARRLSLLLALALAGFATDTWHGISPAWISVAAAILCLLPAIHIVTPKTFTDQMQITPLIYVAGFLGVGAVVADTGLGEKVARLCLDAVGMMPGTPVVNAAWLIAIGAAIGLVATLPGLPAVLTPLAGQLATASGLPLYTVLMLQVPVFSTVLLPYQSPPMMIAMHLGGVGMRDGTRLTVVMTIITLVLLFPLDYVWWRGLGMLP
ncbi:sodium:sulfate symporter [Pandoraea faecigallinarum]|uniref:Sodium:sulfate symporter n=1 Tax=Pandoraea faecigallinarum TaxID=656179 RepID=A0A0H3WQG2_9BURK|nr:SLC13 family permease [Pandoraea faecigallinarum]AKM30404.1 sodium:sulfate symporter [Pandoraea faecigallinarum]